MQNDANVVHLTRVASEPSPNAGAGRLPVILVQVRDKAALQLKQALQALFDNADDTLFEMADRATSNLEQNAFFEAMRDLRLKRKSIERVYLAEGLRGVLGAQPGTVRQIRADPGYRVLR